MEEIDIHLDEQVLEFKVIDNKDGSYSLIPENKALDKQLKITEDSSVVIEAKGIYIGTPGDLHITCKPGGVLVIAGLVEGKIYPFSAKRIYTRYYKEENET